MLKITRLSHKGRGVTIKLEGEIVGAWVDAARDACAIRGRRPRRLDLAAVTYVDAAGVQFLAGLLAEGVEIAACSSFVRALLHPEDPEAPGARRAPESSPSPSSPPDHP